MRSLKNLSVARAFTVIVLGLALSVVSIPPAAAATICITGVKVMNYTVDPTFTDNGDGTASAFGSFDLNFTAPYPCPVTVTATAHLTYMPTGRIITITSSQTFAADAFEALYPIPVTFDFFYGGMWGMDPTMGIPTIADFTLTPGAVRVSQFAPACPIGKC